jgi:hypothetical protein
VVRPNFILFVSILVITVGQCFTILVACQIMWVVSGDVLERLFRHVASSCHFHPEDDGCIAC